MNTRKFRGAFAGIAAAALTATLAACGGDGQGESPASQETGGAGGDAAEQDYDPRAYEGTTVRMLRHSGYDADVMLDAFAEFTEMTGIEVEMDQVPFGELRTKEVTELSSQSSTYDLMSVPDYWLAQYSSAGWLTPITEYVEDQRITDPDFDIEDIDPRLLEANVVDGELYALPWKFNTAVLAYRTDVYDAAPETYEDWLAGVEAAEEMGMSNVGLSLGAANAPELFLNLVAANGGAFLTEDNSAAAFNSPEGQEALEFLIELAESSAPGAVNRAWDESAQLMAQGVTASDYLISSVTNTAASGEAEGKVAFAPLVPAETSSAFMNTWGLLVPSGSANPEAAYMLMQHLLSKDVVRTMAQGGAGSVVPVRESLLTDPELNEQFPAFGALRDVAQNAALWPQIDTLGAARTAIAEPIQNAVLGELSVEDALTQAEADVNQALNP